MAGAALCFHQKTRCLFCWPETGQPERVRRPPGACHACGRTTKTSTPACPACRERGARAVRLPFRKVA